MMKLRCCEGTIGQHLKAESKSSVAASEPTGASTMIVLISLKVPQSHLKSSILIWSFTEERVGSFLGKERSWTILHSEEPAVFGTVPRGDVQKGPIRCLSLEREKGPE